MYDASYGEEEQKAHICGQGRSVLIDAELCRTQCQGAVGIRTVDDIIAEVGFHVVAHGGDAQWAIAEFEPRITVRRVVEEWRCMASRGKTGRYNGSRDRPGCVKQLTHRSRSSCRRKR